MATTIRKNAKPEWYGFKNPYCVSCGQNFENGDEILSGLYCPECSPLKEIELRTEKREINFYGYHSVCVKCGTTFSEEDSILFGKYCEKCGKAWERERKVRQSQARLNKARNIPSANTTAIEKSPNKAAKRKIYRNSSILAYL